MAKFSSITINDQSHTFLSAIDYLSGLKHMDLELKVTVVAEGQESTFTTSDPDEVSVWLEMRVTSLEAADKAREDVIADKATLGK